MAIHDRSMCQQRFVKKKGIAFAAQLSKETDNSTSGAENRAAERTSFIQKHVCRAIGRCSMDLRHFHQVSQRGARLLER